MTVQFDGADWAGWQIQPSQPTVQGALNTALERLLGHPVNVKAAGRTDAGVHALAMPVQFDTEHPIPAGNLRGALSKFLPGSIGVLETREAEPGFDVRRSAILRWYRYQIQNTPLRRPLGPRVWRVPQPLDFDAIEHGLEMLRGTHDFEGFRSSQCQAPRTVLTMEQAVMTRSGDLIALDFKCRSFLHHMIRFLTGTLVTMGHGKLDEARMLRILEHGDRPVLARCAPPEGLSLMNVAYTAPQREAILVARPAPPSF